MPEATAYVGDRFENDVLPAQAAGLTGVLLKREPWGLVDEHHPDAQRASIRIESLAQLLPEIESLSPDE